MIFALSIGSQSKYVTADVEHQTKTSAMPLHHAHIKHIVHEGSLGREKLQRLGVIDNELSFTVPQNKRVPHSS
jgi:hypothetical protein